MDMVSEKISGIFQETFPGCTVDIGPRPGGYTGGFLISDIFEGKDMEERQKIVWSLLRKHLSQDEIVKVSAIFTQTENENSILMEEREAV